MNISSFLFAVISVFTVAATCNELADSNKACTKQLEAIIYHPPNPAYKYLENLTNQLLTALQSVGASSLQDPENISVMRQFAHRYGVDILVQPVIPAAVIPLFKADGTVTTAPRAIDHILGATYLNQPGFDYLSKSKRYRMATYVATGMSSATLILTVPAERIL